MFSVFGKVAPGFVAKLNLLVDLGLLAAALTLASQNKAGFSHASVDWLLAALLATWVVGTRVIRHYDAWAQPSLLEDATMVSVLALSVAALLALVNPRHALESTSLLRVEHFLFVFWPAALATRLLVFRLLLASARSLPPEEVLVLGTGPLGRATGADLATLRHRKLLGYLAFPGEPTSSRLGSSVLGKAEELEAFLRKFPIAEVYLAGSAQRQGEAMQLAITTCERFGVPFAIPAYGFRFSRAWAFNHAANLDGYTHYQCFESKPFQLAVKRVFDIAAASAALAVLMPLLVVVAAIVKLSSKGPIFFKQVRSGLHGRPFHMLKFRSMVVDAEARKAALMAQNEQSGPVFKIKNDPRITAIGRFIRKYSIDELPQLINVLRGDMSVVGPRPPVPSEVAQYEPWQRRRLSVRPGLTCIWQVSGRNQLSFDQWLVLDMRYIDHWNLLSDLSLIVRTVPVVFTGRGAS